MRSGNPSLSENTFKNLEHTNSDSVMTLNGTVNRCLVLLFVCVFAASISWSNQIETANLSGYMWGGAVAGFILALITIFKKNWAPVTAPLYALAEGLCLGALSSIYEAMYPGIVMNAVFLTFGTLFSLLFAYKSGLIKATENFKLGVTAATGAICLVYVASMIMGFFGKQMPYLHESSPLGIGISVVIVIVAALNLVLDFDFIEDGVERQSPKYMEWYAAFGLIVTLIWLYLEMLRLLAKLNSRK